jgi:hypothetical protein
MSSVFEKLEDVLPGYIDRIKNRTNTEDKIVHEFTYLIEKVFDVGPEELDFQAPVKSKVLQVRGRMDTIFKNIILEFKKDLNDKRALITAQEELKKYFQSLYEKDSKIKHIGIATDGINFQVYQGIIENNKISKIEKINEISLDKNDHETIFNWFDSYFFASVKINPTSDHLKQMFGLHSGTFAVIRQELIELYEKVKDERRIKTRFENWARYLEVVYGDKPNEINLFIAHTYLSTFAKLLVYLKLTSKDKFKNYDISPILYGQKFEQLGILNFVEEDFFIWIMYPTIRTRSTKIFEKMLRDLEIYDLDKINEDVLKELYQEMVNPVVRKQLGEFYTPDWLADKMVQDVLDKDPLKSVLDPSCGSGTFLFKTILYKIKRLEEQKMEKSKILDHILENVVGFDIHPLAALISKTNFLLSSQDIINYRKGAITIPVYLSDSLKIPTKKIDVSNPAGVLFEFDTEIDNRKFVFPEKITDDMIKMDELIEKMKFHGHEFEDIIGKIKESSYKIDIDEVGGNLIESFRNAIKDIKNEEEEKILIENIKTLFKLISENRDSIWPYVLRNMFKPISITSKKVDVILGNPPWISLGYMKNLIYQDYVKERSRKYGLVDKRNFQNIANMDLASVFFYQCVDNYLKNKGQIGFVMPQSLTIASQHKNFMGFKKLPFKLSKIIDLENVSPVFRIPSCVLFGVKEGSTKYPVKKEVLSGKLDGNNLQLDKVTDKIKSRTEEYSPSQRETSNNYYYKKFDRGAEITPRNFWFVDIDQSSFLSFNPQKPFVRSSENKESKKPWSELKVEGNIEKEFLFNTILGPNITPFNIIKRRLIVLPIIQEGNSIKLTNSNEIPKTFSLKNYLKIIEELWKENGTEKLKVKPIYDQVNYNGNLLNQKPNTEYKVIYTAAGHHMTSAVVKGKEEYQSDEKNQGIITNRFFVDSSMYYYNADSFEEANYLCSILNSKTIDEFIKPHQSRGNFGARNIHKTPLTYPIPKFDTNKIMHKELSELGKNCSVKSKEILESLNLKGIGSIRNRIREGLSLEISRIDELVKKLE